MDGRRWTGEARFRTDADGVADIATQTTLAMIQAALAPTTLTPTPLASTTAGVAWSHDVAIPSGTVELHLYIDQDAYIVPAASDSDPAANGCLYVGGMTHRIPCRGMAYLHVKRAGASDAAVKATAFVAEA